MDTPLKDDPLASLELFRGLAAEQRAAIWLLMRRRDLLRGEPLVTAGEPSDSLFIVHHGTLDVLLGASGDDGEAGGRIARLRAGDLVGEIGFFAGTPRTATVVASRDASVLQLDRASYEQVVVAAPEIIPALLAAVARRLGDTTRQLPLPPRPTEGRTVAIVPSGVEPVPPLFLERLRASLAAAGARVVDSTAVAARFGAATENAAISRWLNDLEWEGGLLAFLADPSLTEWTRHCVRQADTVVLVTRGPAPGGEPTPVAAFVTEVREDRA
jgi:NTE family protein